MSGIAAVFERQADAQIGMINAVAARMVNIGPDRAGTLVLGPVGLVCCHLGDLTPEDAFDSQPVRTLDGRLAGVFDGRVDNRDELGRSLGLGTSELSGMPDSELFLRAWERWDADAVARIIGPFAAIVWNPGRNELIATRDPFGQRVLYHHSSHDRFVIASTASAIHATGVPRIADEVKVADSLILNYREATRSYFAGITRLAAGHRLLVTAERTRLQRYYDIADLEPLCLARDDDYIEAAHEVLDTAVRAMVRTTAPPSMCLSSGLDSTMVAAAAVRVLRDRGETLHAYTSIPLDRWRPHPTAKYCGDESSGVDAFLAMHPEIVHTYVRATGRGLFDCLDTMMDGAEAPPRNAMNLFWLHEIHRLTRERGARVLLTGGGGNLTLGRDGATLAIDLLRARRLGAFFRQIRSTPATRLPIVQPMFHEVMLRSAPRSVWTGYHRLRKEKVHGWRDFSAIHPDFAEAMHVEERAAEMGFDDTFRPPRTQAEFHARMLANAAQEGADVERGFTAVHGTEVRDPTMDRRVVEFACRIPTDQYRRGGQGRWLQKRMLAGQAPPEVLDPPRRGRQAADFRLRIGADLDRVRAAVEQLAEDPALSPMFDMDRLRAALEPIERWTADEDDHDPGLTVGALSRAIVTARFLQAARNPPGRSPGPRSMWSPSGDGPVGERVIDVVNQGKVAR